MLQLVVLLAQLIEIEEITYLSYGCCFSGCSMHSLVQIVYVFSGCSMHLLVQIVLHSNHYVHQLASMFLNIYRNNFSIMIHAQEDAELFHNCAGSSPSSETLIRHAINTTHFGLSS